MYAVHAAPPVTRAAHQVAPPALGVSNADALAEGRFEATHGSPDHVGIGGSELVQVGPHDLTTGQLNALADYVASPEELAQMPEAALARGLELIMKEPLSAEESAELLAIFPKYKELSLNNGNHFGASDPAVCDPAGGGGPTNRSEIERWLGEAFARAAAAGRDRDGAGLDEALALAAFGGHYVADAFSSGHLFHKGDVMASVAGGIADAGAWAMGGLLAGAAARVSESARGSLDGWRVVGGPLGLRPVTSADLVALMSAVVAFMPEVFHNGVVLAVHDQLSVEGVDVTDGTATWRMFGDHSLDAFSRERCAALLDEVYAAVQGAFVRPDSVPSVAPFLARLPVPTGDEAARIRDVITRASTVSGGGMEDAVVAGSVSQIDAILGQAQVLGVGPFVRVGGGDHAEPGHHDAPSSDHPDAHDFADQIGPWATPAFA